jgi:hypothetical protein
MFADFAPFDEFPNFPTCPQRNKEPLLVIGGLEEIFDTLSARQSDI